MSKTCLKCGAKLGDTAKFCNQCGNKYEEVSFQSKVENEESSGERIISFKTKCLKCGAELKEGMKFCAECGSKVQKDKKHKKGIIVGGILIGLFLILSLFSGGNKEVKLGETIVVDDVLSIAFYGGKFSENDIMPKNAAYDYEGIAYSGDGMMYGIYGIVNNLSTEEIDLNEVCEITLIFDGKYESNATIWLENEAQTAFLNFDLSDYIFPDPEADIYPKDKYYCTAIGQIGKSIFEELDEEQAIIARIKILKDINSKDYVVYEMPFTVS